MTEALGAGSARRWQRSDATALGSLVLLTAVLFHRILFAGRILYERDVNAWFYPWAQVFTRILREGSWPLWNPYVAFGQPLLANPSHAVLYPPTWAIPLTSPWTYYTGFVVLHSLIGAAGIYVLCRTLSLSAAAAFVASAVWLTSGPWLSFVNVGCHHMAGVAWMPVHLVAAEWCFRAPSARRALVWGTVAGVQLLAGSADMAFMSAALVGGRLLARLAANRDGRSWRSLLGTSALASMVAVCLAAAQWIPAAELAMRSARIALGDAAQTEWSVHPLFLLQTVVPLPLKDLRLSTYPWELVFQARDPLLYSLYLGLPAAALVAAAMASRETPWRLYLVAGLILATIVALGHHTPVYGHLLGLVPPLRMLRFPMKVMVAVGLLWSVLAGAGFDQLRKAGERPARVALIVLSSAVGVLLIVAIVLHVFPSLASAWLDPEPGQPAPGALAPLRAQWIRSGGLSLLLAFLLVLRRAGRRLPYTPLIALCVVADLFTMHVGLNDTAPRDVLSFRPPIVDVVSSPGRSRVYVFDYSLPSRIPAVVARAPHLLSAYDVAPTPGWIVAVGHRTYLFPTILGTWGLEGSYDRDIQDFFPPHLATMSRLIRAAEGLPAQVRLLRAGAVGRVVAHHASGFPGLVPLARVPGLARAPILVFAVPDPVPRSYVAAAAPVAGDHEAITTLLSEEFDLRREVILAPTAARPVAARSMAAGPVGRSRIAQWRPDRVTIEAEAEGPAFLVLVDAFDPGWRATVDGRPAPILRANVAFRAVAIDAGSHVVEFVYRPASVAWGLGLSTITLLGLSLAAWRWRHPSGRADG